MMHSPGFLALVESVMPNVKEVSCEDAASAFNLGRALLIDVREDHEWAQSHVSGALHMGRGIIERDIEMRVSDKASPLMLYCGGGFRSALVADNLQKMGYTHVYSVQGGFRAWKEKGLPVSSPS